MASSNVVKRGYANVREDGFKSFLWPKRWLLLRDQTLTLHRNEVGTETPRARVRVCPCLSHSLTRSLYYKPFSYSHTLSLTHVVTVAVTITVHRTRTKRWRWCS